MSWMVVAFLCVSSLGIANSSECSKIANCVGCDRLLDSSGNQMCSWCVGSQACVPQHGLECVFGAKISKADDCPRLEKPGIFYNDTFARNEMFAISAAAYADNPQTCMDNMIPGALVRKQVSFLCDSTGSGHCAGFTAVSTRRKAMILGFRGSDGKIQLFLEGWETLLTERINIVGGGQVSRYYYNAFDKVWQSIRDDFLDMVETYNGYELWIGGHSLGGAIASIAAQVIAYSGYYDPKYIKLMTFGQPRTGDHDFVAAHDNAILYSYRVTHRQDMVIHLPARGFEGYHHHRYEIYYNNDMSEGSTYTECYTPDDDACSNSNLLAASVDDHLHYFGRSIATVGRQGCTE